MLRLLATILLSCLLILILPQPAKSGEKQTILIDDFSGKLEANGLPAGWELKETEGKAQVKVETEQGNQVLRLTSSQSSFGLQKEVEIDVKKYPIISWRWKVTKLPKGGDVRSKETDDQAAQLYLHFAKFPQKVNFYEVGYIWENLVPVGSMLPSQNIFGSRVQYVVIQSGPQNLGQWVSEQRNLYEDYKKLFKEEPPELLGVGLMIDSDDTNSQAECYFDDLILQAP